MTRKIAMIGSATFPLDTAIGAQVVDVMKEYGEDVVFLTRGSPGFDTFVGHVALTLGRPCFTYPGKGSTDNFVRDAELVTDCDELIAFVDPAQLDKPHHGTGMVIERALTTGKPVRAASLAEGTLIWEART